MFYVDKKYQKRIFFQNIYMNDVCVIKKPEKMVNLCSMSSNFGFHKTQIDTAKKDNKNLKFIGL